MDRIQILCHECGNEMASLRCVECEQHLCSDCDSALHSGGKRRTHERIMICEECENRESVLFCRNCEQYLCPECDKRIHNKGARRNHQRVKKNAIEPPDQNQQTKYGGTRPEANKTRPNAPLKQSPNTSGILNTSGSAFGRETGPLPQQLKQGLKEIQDQPQKPPVPPAFSRHFVTFNTEVPAFMPQQPQVRAANTEVKSEIEDTKPPMIPPAPGLQEMYRFNQLQPGGGFRFMPPDIPFKPKSEQQLQPPPPPPSGPFFYKRLTPKGAKNAQNQFFEHKEVPTNLPPRKRMQDQRMGSPLSYISPRSDCKSSLGSESNILLHKASGQFEVIYPPERQKTVKVENKHAAVIEELQKILFERARQGQVMLDYDTLFSAVVEHFKISNKEARAILATAEQNGIVHTMKRQFGVLRSLLFVSLKLEHFSLEALHWTLLSLKRDQMLPTERAIMSRVKEAFALRLQGQMWEGAMESIARSVKSRKNSFEMHSPPRYEREPPFQFELSETLDPTSGANLIVVFPLGDRWEGIDQKNAPVCLDDQDQVLYKDLCSFLEHYFVGDIELFWEKYDPHKALLHNLAEVRAYYAKNNSGGGSFGSAKKTPRERIRHGSSKQGSGSYEVFGSLGGGDRKTPGSNKKNSNRSDGGDVLFLSSGEELRTIPGGRYGCTQFLKVCGPESLKQCSLGKLAQLVQRTISEDLLRYQRTLLVWTGALDKRKVMEGKPESRKTNSSLKSSGNLNDSFRAGSAVSDHFPIHSKSRSRTDIANAGKFKATKNAVLEVLRENESGISLAQLPLYLKPKLTFPLDLAELGFAKLKDLILAIGEDLVNVELRGHNHPFAVLSQYSQKERLSQSMTCSSRLSLKESSRTNDSAGGDTSSRTESARGVDKPEEIKDPEKQNTSLEHILDCLILLLREYPLGVEAAHIPLLLQSRMNSTFDIRLFGCQNILEFIRRYVMPSLDVELFKASTDSNPENGFVIVRLREQILPPPPPPPPHQMHSMIPAYLHHPYFHQASSQHPHPMQYSPVEVRPGSVNSSTGGSGTLEQQRARNAQEEARVPQTPHFYPVGNTYPPPPPPPPQGQQSGGGSRYAQYFHHQQQPSNLTTSSRGDSFYNYYSYGHGGSIDSQFDSIGGGDRPPAHGYQPSTASVIYNPGAAGGGLESSLASAVNIDNQGGSGSGGAVEQTSGTSHSRSNTDTQLPSAKMIDSTHSAQQTHSHLHSQQSMDLNSPGNVRVAWGSVPAKPGFIPTQQWMMKGSGQFSGSWGQGSPHFGSNGNFIYEFSPHAFYSPSISKGTRSRSNSPSHQRTISYWNVYSNCGSVDLSGPGGPGHAQRYSGTSQLGAAVAGKTIGKEGQKGAILGPFVGRDLRPQIAAAAGTTPGQVQGERKSKSNGSEENERHNTSGVLEEESIVKSIEKIIESQETKELSGSPETYQMKEEIEGANDFIRIQNSEAPQHLLHDDEFDREMQIPCEQGGVCPPVPIWGGGGMPTIEGHLKAFSTDFWVWSKFNQRQVTPAQQTKYFSTNQQAYERPEEKSTAVSAATNAQKLEEIKELTQDYDANQ